MTDNKQAVLTGIREGRSQQEIATDLGLTKQYVSSLVRRMVDEGLVTEVRRAVFRVTDEPHHYRKVPAVIEAVRVTEDNAETIIQWAYLSDVMVTRIFAEGQPTVLGLMFGTKRADIGDWIVKADGGLFYREKPEAFAQTYVAVVDDE